MGSPGGASSFGGTVGGNVDPFALSLGLGGAGTDPLAAVSLGLGSAAANTPPSTSPSTPPTTPAAPPPVFTPPAEDPTLALQKKKAAEADIRALQELSRNQTASLLARYGSQLALGGALGSPLR